MVELLMVILIISLLSAVAVPQFLNFQQEAKVAALEGTLAAVRTGIQNQKMQKVLRCGADSDDILTFSALEDNSLSELGDCSLLQVPNPADRKIVSSDSIPANPLNSQTEICECNTGSPCLTDPCGECDGVTPESAEAAGYGWYYDETNTGDFWAFDPIGCQLGKN